MQAEKEDTILHTRPSQTATAKSWARTIISLTIFIAVDYWIFKSWAAVILLVSVLIIHESGHFVAMKVFGYRGVRMTFVPFMGAFVSGESTHFSKFKRIIVLLAGPLPGIVIGMALLVFYQNNLNQFYYLAALAFILLNVFNLLPVSPLDGGQFIETMYFERNLVVQLSFLGLSILVLAWLLYTFNAWFLLLIGWLLARRIVSIHLTYKVRKALDQQQIPYDSNYDDLTDEQYAQIRDVLITSSRVLSSRFTPGEFSIRESELIKYIEKILVPTYDYELTAAQKTGFLVAYLVAIILPLVQIAYVKAWF